MTTQERIAVSLKALETFKVDASFKASDYKTAGDALRASIDVEDSAWTEWRDNGKADELRRKASDIQSMWHKRARAISREFPTALSPDDAILYFEALMVHTSPLPPELQKIVDAFRKPTFVSKSGRAYGERAISSMKHYAIAVSVFDDYRDIIVDALTEYSK